MSEKTIHHHLNAATAHETAAECWDREVARRLAAGASEVEVEQARGMARLQRAHAATEYRAARRLQYEAWDAATGQDAA